MSQVQVGYISVEDTSDFAVGEYIVVETDSPQIVKIQDISGSDRIDLVNNIKGPIPVGTKISKSYGTYNQGMYVFGKRKDVSVATQEKYIILNDDAQPMLLTKNIHQTLVMQHK